MGISKQIDLSVDLVGAAAPHTSRSQNRVWQANPAKTWAGQD